jgi:hypothetical protein
MRVLFLAFLTLISLAIPASADERHRDATLYELRIYHPAPRKAEELNTRFREHTVEFFRKHGMVNVGYWNEQATPEAPEGRLIYVLAYPSRSAREASWEAFRADPEWQAVKARSEAGGILVTRVESVYMNLTDYSPALGSAR